MSRCIHSFLAGIAAGFLLALPAAAEPKTVRFSGVVTEIFTFSAQPFDFSSVTSAFFVNDSVQVDITYETTTPEVGFTINAGEYDGAVVAVNGRVGSTSFGLSSNVSNNEILTLNDALQPIDEFRVRFVPDGPSLGPFRPSPFRLSVVDLDNTAYPDGVPPLDPIDFSLFDTGSGTLAFNDSSGVRPANINFVINSITAIPEPSTISYLAFGGMAILTRCRRI